MKRRQFLATGGLAASLPAIAASSSLAETEHGSGAVNFFSDGLNLTPREYTTILAQQSDIAADNYSLGGEVEKLERQFAELLGKEAAMFVPTGTLANHLAIRTLAGNRRRVLVQAESHLYNDSGDGASTLSGLNLVPLAAGRTSMELDEVKSWVERTRGGRVAQDVGVISIESPVRRREHEWVSLESLDAVCDYAREQGIRLHLDGARLFNLPLHSGRSVKDYASRFDTVYVSLWKHFNGTAGAMLAGDRSLIDGLFHSRRMFGSALPQAWPTIAPVGLFATRYENDYSRAWQAADQLIGLLEQSGRFLIRKLDHGTCRFFLKVTSDVSPEELVARTGRLGINLPPVRADSGEFALQVNPSILRRPVPELASTFLEASSA